MSSNAILAQGTIIARETSPGSGTYTTIAEAKSIDGPGIDRDEIDVTHQQSPSKHREFIAGLRDSGEISFDVNYNPNDATHNAATGFLSRQVSGVVENYRLTFPSSPPVSYIVPAFVKSAKPTAPVDNVLGMAVVLRVASAPTLA